MTAPNGSRSRKKAPDRDSWLAALVHERRGWFAQNGVHLPPVIHVCAGWGYAGGARHAEAPHIQAHLVSGTRTSDGAPQVFVTPVEPDPFKVAAYLDHQLLHAALDPDLRHASAFRHAAKAVGLVGRPTEPALGADLREMLTEWMATEGGPYPPATMGTLVAPLTPGRTTTAPEPQRSRYLAARCPSCPGVRTKHRTVHLSGYAAKEGAPICGRILVPETDEGVPAVRCQHVMLIEAWDSAPPPQARAQ